MAQRNIYQANNSSAFLPSYPDYPPQERLSDSLEDYKPPAEHDIIDSYASTAVPLPKHSYPLNASSPNLPAYQSPVTATYPPFNPKPSFHSTNMSATEFDTEENSSYGLYSKEVIPPPAEKRSLLGKLLPESLACRFYILVIFIETIIDIAIETELRGRVVALGDKVSSDLTSKRLPVYLAMFAAAHLFQLVMAIDAVHARNTLQFIFLTVFNAFFLLYSIVQIFEIQESLPANDENGGVSNIPVNVLVIIIPCVIAVSEIAYIALGWKIWREFGWKVYKRLGADRRVKKMYAKYQIFIGIMKFDLFFFVCFCVQLIALVLNEKDWEYYLTWAALPFSVLVLVDGSLAARWENRWMMYSFMLGCAGALFYFCFKVYRLYSADETIEDVSKTMTVFAVIAIILLILTVVIAFMVLSNFGGGLKSKINQPARSNSLKRGKTSAAHMRNQSFPMSSNPNRMSID